ncbi:MAG: hypothetical protein ABIQ88_11210 [Chitinophagaceae bacterium]
MIKEKLYCLAQESKSNYLVTALLLANRWKLGGFFLILCLICTGWYNTADKLDNYIANDTKWRYLKLDTVRKSFLIYLLSIDSFYNSNADLRKTVLAQEEQNG